MHKRFRAPGSTDQQQTSTGASGAAALLRSPGRWCSPAAAPDPDTHTSRLRKHLARGRAGEPEETPVPPQGLATQAPGPRARREARLTASRPPRAASLGERERDWGAGGTGEPTVHSRDKGVSVSQGQEGEPGQGRNPSGIHLCIPRRVASSRRLPASAGGSRAASRGQLPATSPGSQLIPSGRGRAAHATSPRSSSPAATR